MQLNKDEAAVRFWEITTERLKEINMTGRDFCKLTGLPEHSFLAMKGKKMCPNIWFYFRAKEVLGIEYAGLFETLQFSSSDYFILSEDEKKLIREVRKERATKREKTIRFLLLLLKYKQNPNDVVFASEIGSSLVSSTILEDDTDVSEESDGDEEIEMKESDEYLTDEEEIDGEKSVKDEQNFSCLPTQKPEDEDSSFHDIDNLNVADDKGDEDDDIEVVMNFNDDEEVDSTEPESSVDQQENTDIFKDEAVTADAGDGAISVSAKVEASHNEAASRHKKTKVQDEQPTLFDVDNFGEEC